MSKDQINELKADLDTMIGNSSQLKAEKLYAKGWRKQSEGEWVVKSLTSKSQRGRTINYSTYQCSVCGTWNGRHIQKYCHECGAKMKGGAE